MFAMNFRATDEQKSFGQLLRVHFSSLFVATSCDQYFSNYDFDIPKVWTITISMLIISSLLVLEQKLEWTVYRKSYPENAGMYYISMSN
jgi:hypothetical protein